MAASGGMVLYSKIHEDITPTSQAERQREGQFQYRCVRVFGGEFTLVGFAKALCIFFASSPCKDKGKNQE